MFILLSISSINERKRLFFSLEEDDSSRSTENKNLDNLKNQLQWMLTFFAILFHSFAMVVTTERNYFLGSQIS